MYPSDAAALFVLPRNGCKYDGTLSPAATVSCVTGSKCEASNGRPVKLSIETAQVAIAGESGLHNGTGVAEPSGAFACVTADDVSETTLEGHVGAGPPLLERPL